jgi:hypothetical protein
MSISKLVQVIANLVGKKPKGKFVASVYKGKAKDWTSTAETMRMNAKGLYKKKHKFWIG